MNVAEMVRSLMVNLLLLSLLAEGRRFEILAKTKRRFLCFSVWSPTDVTERSEYASWEEFS